MTAIEWAAVGRTFRTGGDQVVAVDGVSLSVGVGEVLGLLGHNGAGKTTLVRLAAGVLAPTSGRVRVNGLDPVVHGVAVRRTLGVLPTGTFVDVRLSARQNLRFAADLFGLDRDGLERRIDEALDDFGLLDQADTPVAGFSAGMRQRLALARVLLPEPAILLLDEPSTQLDPLAVARVRDLIARLARESGRTVVLCTHDLHEAQLLCDRVVVLDRGRVAGEGSPAELAATLGGHALDIEVDREDAAVARSVIDGRHREVPASVESEVAPPVGPSATEAEVRAAANGAGTVVLRAKVDRPEVPGLVRELALSGVRVYGVRPHEPSLEEAYLRLYGEPGAGRSHLRELR